jgi:hypothetical protein
MWAAYDDLWAPTFLQEALGLLHASPEAVGCVTAVKIIDEAGNPLETIDPGGGLAAASRVARARSVERAGWFAAYGLYRRQPFPLMPDDGLPDVFGSDFVFVFRLALHNRFVTTSRPLFTWRKAGYEQMLGPDGEMYWEKALGSESHLYSQETGEMCRCLLSHIREAPMSLEEKALLRAHVARLWFHYTRNRVAARNLLRVNRALMEHRSLRARSLMIKHAVIQPRFVLSLVWRRLAKRSIHP